MSPTSLPQRGSPICTLQGAGRQSGHLLIPQCPLCPRHPHPHPSHTGKVKTDPLTSNILQNWLLCGQPSWVSGQHLGYLCHPNPILTDTLSWFRSRCFPEVSCVRSMGALVGDWITGFRGPGCDPQWPAQGAWRKDGIRTETNLVIHDRGAGRSVPQDSRDKRHPERAAPHWVYTVTATGVGRLSRQDNTAVGYSAGLW